MNFKDLIRISNTPDLYEPGDAIMWTDEYIARQLLEMHLNPEIDAATRTPPSIENTLEFIIKFCNRPEMKILDLGCGPGIYTEKLSLKGHHVTGIDFSKNSIRYAAQRASEKQLDINYICQDYLEINYQDQFDLIMLIYTDFGVLIPEERDKLLSLIHAALKPGGIFIFDVLNDRNVDQKFQDHRSWLVENGGFWMNSPYLELIQGIHYEDERVFLKQHTIISEYEACRTYRFWIHYYKAKDLIPILHEKGFNNIETDEKVLPQSDLWNGENVTFYTVKRPE